MIRSLWLAAAAAAAWTMPAAAQYTSAGPQMGRPAAYAETASSALARHMRTLASSPRNYEALIGAGRASLELGDSQAAVGFFGRAEEVNPRSWACKVGQGAAMVQMLEPQAAMLAFADAQRLGAGQGSVALERGLAFDLMGDQARAQSDYRVAMSGGDPNEARRRMALSLAISGKRAEALSMLDPLLARRDPGAIRARAFVLALTGDPDGAKSAVNAALPGMAATMDPFLRRLVSLGPVDKAAAVHFGVMPGSGSAPTYAGADPVISAQRMAEIERFLQPPAATTQQRPVAAPPQAAVQPAPVRIAAVTPQARPVTQPPVPVRTDTAGKVWVQLASGKDPAALPDQFRRMKSRNRDLFDGISGYLAQENDKSRLLIGPFRNTSEARTFAEDLQSAAIDAFPWTSAGQSIRKLP